MNCEKAKIVSIGFVIEGIPVNWVFDGEGRAVAAITIDEHDEVKLVAGYTIEELKEMSDKFYS